ncbi:hypothetical protein [Agrococcus baldri]|nr:hypothetical protein [Agrococcus baldri]
MDTAATDRTVPASARPWLSQRWRKAALVLHILGAGTWIGIDVLVAVLVLVGWFSPDAQLAGLAYRALGTFVVAPMLAAALVTLGTGLLLGLGTRWGLVRHWWVLVKLVLNVVLAVLIVVALQPGMEAVVAHGEALAGGAAPSGDVRTLFFPPAVSLAALSLATALAVVKPWGRVRPAAALRRRSR